MEGGSADEERRGYVSMLRFIDHIMPGVFKWYERCERCDTSENHMALGMFLSLRGNIDRETYCLQCEREEEDWNSSILILTSARLTCGCGEDLLALYRYRFCNDACCERYARAGRLYGQFVERIDGPKERKRKRARGELIF